MDIYSQWLILDYLQVKIGPAVHYCLIVVSSDWGASSDISKNINLQEKKNILNFL